MNNVLKKSLILFFVILIPLSVAYLIGHYGYTNNKFGQGTWKTEFRNEYLTFADKGTTEEKLSKWIQFGLNNQYFSYDPTPIYNETIKNEQNENLFKFEIYRALYKTTVSGEKVDRIQYLYFIYDVQYLKLRNEFTGDQALLKEIEKADVPKIRINLYEVLENDQIGDKDFVQMTATKLIYDIGADVDYLDGTVLEEGESSDKIPDVYIISGFDPIPEINWSTKTKIEVVAHVSGVTDASGEDISKTIFEHTLTNFETDPSKLDLDDYLTAYQQNVDNVGYFKWVFWQYLWWICLIAFVSIGFITGSFYLVWLAEEQKAAQTKRYKKVKK